MYHTRQDPAEVRLRDLPQYSSAACLLPDDSLRVWWNFVVMMYLLLRLMLYTSTVIPLKIAFFQDETTAGLAIDLAVSFLFFVDVLMTSVSAYYDSEETLITSKKQIVKHYLTTWMVLDLAGAIPYQLFLEQNWGGLLRLARLPRMNKLAQMPSLLKFFSWARVTYGLSDNPAVTRVIWYQVRTLVLAHLISCAWFALARYSDDAETWVTKAGLQDESAYELYVVSVYWTIKTCTTVGYGDITPANLSEILFVCPVMVTGVIYYSSSVSMVRDAIQAQKSLEAKCAEEAEAALQRLARRIEISQGFYRKVRNAVHRQKLTADYEKKTMIAELPRKLGTRLNVMLNQRLLGENFFFSNKPLAFATRLLLFVKPLLSKQGEHLFKKGDWCDSMYFIVEGEIELYEKFKGHEIAFTTLSTGDYFGDVELLLHEILQYNARAKTECFLLTISKEHLLKDVLSLFEDIKNEIIVEAQLRETLYAQTRTRAANKFLAARDQRTPRLRTQLSSVSTDAQQSFRKIMTSPRNNIRDYEVFQELKKGLSPSTRQILDEKAEGQRISRLAEMVTTAKECLQQMQHFFPD